MGLGKENKWREAEANITIAFLLILDHQLALMKTQGSSWIEVACIQRNCEHLTSAHPDARSITALHKSFILVSNQEET